jgi:hypothetical protein
MREREAAQAPAYQARKLLGYNTIYNDCAHAQSGHTHTHTHTHTHIHTLAHTHAYTHSHTHTRTHTHLQTRT